jgi:hypothetical protein
MPRVSAWMSIALLLTLASTARPAAPPPAVKSAILRSLPLLLKGAKGHIAKRSCFACHNQAIPMLALTTARDRGFVIRDEDIKKQTEHIAAFIETNRKLFLEGKGTGGRADTAGYALLALEWGGWKADGNTAAVVEYLLQYRKDKDHWPCSSNRPPSEASAFTTTYVAARGLSKWGKDDQKKRIAKRIETIRAWVQKAPAKDTEDRVFRLWALAEVGVKGKALEEARQALLKSQRGDGGWGQLDRLDSDAYATGSALVALHRAGGLPTSDKAYQRGLAFLLKSQRPDGSWLVRSRSVPFQAYYESGFPHKKDQFISMAATSWAVTALALTCPPRLSPKLMSAASGPSR